MSIAELAISIGNPKITHITKYINLSALLTLKLLLYVITIINLWKNILIYANGHNIILYTVNINTIITSIGIYAKCKINTFNFSGFLLVNKNGAKNTCTKFNGAGNDTSEL
jgi:hypothetical protein